MNKNELSKYSLKTSYNILINLLKSQKEKKPSKKRIKKNKYKRIYKRLKPKSALLNKYLLLFLLLLIILIILYIIVLRVIKQSNITKKNYLNNNITISAINNNGLENNPFLNLTKFFEKRMNELKRSSIEYPLPKEIIFKPEMTDKDLKAFSYFMKKENIYFEFGSGGSTNLAFYYKLKKIYSVESDINWHNKLKINNINITYLTVDLKAIPNKFGTPGSGTNVEDWKKYIQAYKSEYNADIILIDGRFRVACGLDIFSKIKYDTLVLIHDYIGRNSYHILEKYYIKVECWDTLCAFFKNPNISSIPKDVYDKYIYIFGL